MIRLTCLRSSPKLSMLSRALNLAIFLAFFSRPTYAALNCADLFKTPTVVAQIYLTSPKGTSENYTNLINEVKPGNTIVVGKNEVFKILNILGSGSEHFVFETTERGKKVALRVPRHYESAMGVPSNPVHNFVSSYDNLRRNGIPTPKLIRSDGMTFAVVEKLEIEFTLEDVLRGEINLQDEFVEQAKEKLLLFADKTINFNLIEDLHVGNLGFVKGQWVLFDWGGAHEIWNRQNKSETVFDNMFANPKFILDREAFLAPDSPSKRMRRRIDELGRELANRVRQTRQRNFTNP